MSESFTDQQFIFTLSLLIFILWVGVGISMVRHPVDNPTRFIMLYISSMTMVGYLLFLSAYRYFLWSIELENLELIGGVVRFIVLASTLLFLLANPQRD